MSGLPAWLAPWLPADTARSWYFFEEAINLAVVRADPFAVTEHEGHTLNGQFHETKVQLLHAAKQTRLEPTTEIAGVT
jgi:hypothetical protein